MVRCGVRCSVTVGRILCLDAFLPSDATFRNLVRCIGISNSFTSIHHIFRFARTWTRSENTLYSPSFEQGRAVRLHRTTSASSRGASMLLFSTAGESRDRSCLKRTEHFWRSERLSRCTAVVDAPGVNLYSSNMLKCCHRQELRHSGTHQPLPAIYDVYETLSSSFKNVEGVHHFAWLDATYIEPEFTHTCAHPGPYNENGVK